MADPGKSQGEGLDKNKLKQYLVPALAVAAVIVLAGLVMVVSGNAARSMSDGSNGSTTDPDLKEASPGVKYRDLKEGVGDACPAGASVTIHYTGWLENGDVFDSNREGKPTKDPVTFELSNLIKGWQEGIPGMKKGGIRKLVISSDKGYGPRGSPPKIPGGATLVFEVELVDFKAAPGAPRARRSPPPSDLTKLSDGTAPGADDPGLKPLGTGGLKYRDIKVGDGPECPEGGTPVMDYIGWLTSGGQPFDTSFNRDAPLDMPLGKLIKGWQQGVPGMKVGGIRKLVIPSDLGYGPDGSPPKIPGGATLVFEVELLGIK